MNIGIVGSGAMGSGIAQVAAIAGDDVFIYDNNPAALEQAQNDILNHLNRQVDKGRIIDEEAKAIFSKLYFINNFNTLKESDLIIEAIVEDLEAKKQLFRDLNELTDGRFIVSTNTSSLSVTTLANSFITPQKFVGIHFFNPAPVMKLVEIIPAVQTSSDTLSFAQEIVESWGKTTVVAQDTPGFIVNRVARPFYSEAIRIYEEGLATPEEIDYAMIKYGDFKMGPFELMDYIGHDVNFNVTEIMYKAYYGEPRYKPSHVQKKLVEAGFLGRKTGKGFYNYIEREPQIPEVDLSKKKSLRIFRRILYMLINEAADALHYGIADAKSIDLAMTEGVNYPKGLLEWADKIGIRKVVSSLDELFEYYHDQRYRVSPKLRRMSDKKHKFYP